MELGYDRDLYILAFDHRGSFQKKLFGIAGEPTPEETEGIIDAKAVIGEGFRKALDEGAPRDEAGLLVDEQFGADIARKARADGLVLAMPVEKTGQDEFDFDYGDDFGAHIEEFDPTFAKVLVRWNPEGDAEMNRRQGKRLGRLSGWLRDRDRKLLFELLVPATEAQMRSVDRDDARYDLELRPGLMLQTMREIRDAGVEPDVWKIEGLNRREDCERTAALAREDGRDGVACVVLGRGADEAGVVRWLQAGAGVPGYRGFAIGRTIWWDALKDWLAGMDRDEAVGRIAASYRRMIDAYRAAA